MKPTTKRMLIRAAERRRFWPKMDATERALI